MKLLRFSLAMVLVALTIVSLIFALGASQRDNAALREEIATLKQSLAAQQAREERAARMYSADIQAARQKARQWRGQAVTVEDRFMNQD